MEIHNTLIAGVVGAGKTIWLLKLASEVLKQGHSVGFITTENNLVYIAKWLKQFCTDDELKKFKVIHVPYGTDVQMIKFLIINHSSEYVFIDDVNIKDLSQYEPLTSQRTLVLSTQAPSTCYNRPPCDQHLILELDVIHPFELLISYKEPNTRRTSLYEFDRCVSEIDLTDSIELMKGLSRG